MATVHLITPLGQMRLLHMVQAAQAAEWLHSLASDAEDALQDLQALVDAAAALTQQGLWGCAILGLVALEVHCAKAQCTVG